MPKPLHRLKPKPRKATDRFTHSTGDAGIDLASFWSWVGSDLVVNTTRGLLAEYLVAHALGDPDPVRDPWRPFDVRTPGGTTVEVKSASLHQSWAQQRVTDISFSIGQSRAWDPETGLWDTERKRQAELYVFCVLKHENRDSLDPMDLTQWRFYVLPTKALNTAGVTRKSIGMQRLLKLGPAESSWERLAMTVNEVSQSLKAADG